MNNFKPLIIIATVTIALFGVFLLVEIDRLWNTAATTNTVSFNGEGKVLAVPDIAMISASIVTQAVNSKTAQDQNSKKSQAVADFLKKQGIDEKDIKTTDYNIYPQYKYSSYGGQATITGYQVTQSYQVKVRDLEKVSAVLDGLVSAGANQVNNLGLQVEDPEKLKTEARQKAIEDAKKKADELKDQVGIKLGRIVNFSENTGGYPIPMMYATDRGIGGCGGAEISVGQNEIVVSVTITYQIK